MVLAMNSSDTMRFGRFLYVMKSLNDVTPIRTASGMPSRMYGSWFRMKWKPKSSTESAPASSRRRPAALGSVSPSSYTTNGRSVVSPVRAAASGAVFQSSYSGPDVQVAVDQPGQHELARGVDHAVGRRQHRLRADGGDAVALDGHRRLEHVGRGDHLPTADDRVDPRRAHRCVSFSVTGWSSVA